jgi:hypothetical protein
MDFYDVGDRVQPSADFGADQTTVTATVRAPDGTLTDYSGAGVTHDSVGVYHVDYDTTQVGLHEWEITGDHDVQQGAFEVLPLLKDVPPDQLASNCLCSLADVFSYVPGFEPEDEDNQQVLAKLRDLIGSQSVEIANVTGLEFTPAVPTNNPRLFDVGVPQIETREVVIGEASVINSITQIRQGATITTIAPPSVVYEPRVRKPWQPIRALRFPWYVSPPVILWFEDVLQVDAVWGYPSIPTDIRQACAKMVVVRYVTDVANSGTAFSDAARDGDISLAGLLVSAREAIGGYTILLP